MDEFLTKLSYLDLDFYKTIKLKDSQVLWFNYTDLNIKGLTFQPYINFLIKYFEISQYVEIGIAAGTNFLSTCQYIQYRNKPCAAQGISLYDVPIQKINKLSNDDLIVSRNLAADNMYSFAKITNVSLSDGAINYLDKNQPGLIVLNQIKDFKIENINDYFEAAGGNSIILISKYLFDKNAKKAVDHVKSCQMKFLETKDAIILFKDFDNQKMDSFLEEFGPLYLKPLDFITHYLMDKAKCHQTTARTNDLFNLNLVKSQKEKHFFSVLGLFRNESMVLKEWMEHYIKLGVDHFYLVDNNSKDNYYEILRPYIERGLVTLYTCAEEKYQMGMLRELTNVLKNETIWVGAFDLDEFIYPPHSPLITDVIKKFDTYEAIIIPWLVFGSNGHIQQPESIVSGFTKRMKYEGQYSHTKAIVKTASITILTQHVPWTKNNNHVMCNGKGIHYRPTKIKLFESEIPGMELLNNHYALQSVEYFQKVKVGRTEVAENSTGKKKTIIFTKIDQMANEIVDTTLALKKQA